MQPYPGQMVGQKPPAGSLLVIAECIHDVGLLLETAYVLVGEVVPAFIEFVGLAIKAQGILQIVETTADTRPVMKGSGHKHMLGSDGLHSKRLDLGPARIEIEELSIGPRRSGIDVGFLLEERGVRHAGLAVEFDGDGLESFNRLESLGAVGRRQRIEREQHQFGMQLETKQLER